MKNKQKPQTLKGFRDFLPEQKRKKDWLRQKLVPIFATFGFEPLETPTLESADLLLGKYGPEAEKLIYTFEDRGQRKIGLRYDQTVPTARVLAQYGQQLPKFFRRYQIQPVFRAEKPQKGRFREFWQCDIDIFGSLSPIADAEIIACAYFCYKNIGFDNFSIIYNDRNALVKSLQQFENKDVDVFSIIQSIDKLDKKGRDEVLDELIKKGLTPNNAQKALESLKNIQLPKNLNKIIDYCLALGVARKNLRFSSTLARGLDYYTGMIFEVVIEGFDAGSVGGGGRFDNLIKHLSGVHTPAVGFAFGMDRLLEAAEKFNLIPKLELESQIMVTIFSQELIEESLKIARALRTAGIGVEIYPNFKDKLSKQLKYANKKQIRLVLILGPDEIKLNKVRLKNLNTGEQKLLKLEQAIAQIKKI